MRAKLEVWSKSFTQEVDCCSSSEAEFQVLVVEQDDGGGGPFWIFKTQRWAFDDLNELIALIESAGVPREARAEVAS